MSVGICADLPHRCDESPPDVTFARGPGIPSRMRGGQIGMELIYLILCVYYGPVCLTIKENIKKQ